MIVVNHSKQGTHVTAMLIGLIRAIHYLIVIFALVGWAIPWRPATFAHALQVPLMVLHWWTNTNTCFLTNLENRLRRRDEQEKTKVNQEFFIKGILDRLLPCKLSKPTIDMMIYIVLALVWSLSLWQLVMED